MWLSVIVLSIIPFLTLVLTLVHYSTKARKYWLFKKVSYREPCPIFGNFGATLLMRKSYTETLNYFYKTYRKEKFVGIFQARRPSLLMIDLDLIKSIFSTEFNSFGDRLMVTTDTKREPLIRNVANMSGAEWKWMRTIITPTFSSAKMKAMFPLVAECANTLKSVLLQHRLDDVDIFNYMTRYTTDVIGSCAFGVNPGSLRDPNSPFLKIAGKMFKPTRSLILKRYLRSMFPRLYKLLNLKSYSSEVEVFISTTIKQVLNERRETGIVRNDFLQLMLNAQAAETGSAMTDELIISNSFIFMLAGLESTAISLSFCLYELAKDQELQDRLREEILHCLQRGGLSYEAATEMKLVTQTFLETLRMHPSTPMVTRMCTTACTLPGTELSLKVGEVVLMPIHCVHRDPAHFPHPDKFDPGRFDDTHNPLGFMPFGDGPRSCPGARFAQLMVIAGLSVMLSTFRVEPCAKTTPRIEYDPRSFMLKNKGGIWLKFSPLG